MLKNRGAKIKFKNIHKKNNEIVGNIQVSSKACSIKAGSTYYASSADEYPIMFIISALIPGVSVFKGIKDLANKESNHRRNEKNINSNRCKM